MVFILSVVFGGFLVLADAVNNFGSSKSIGFLPGIVLIILFLIRFIYKNISINVDQPDLHITYNEIYALTLNAQRLNTLTLFRKSDEVLFHIHPFNHQLMPGLVNEIKKAMRSGKSVTQNKLLKITYNMIVYQCK